MQTAIHPKFFSAKVICSCGNTFNTQSTKSEIHVEVCSKCHPFYTGEHRFLDTKGRVESFQKKQEKAKQYKTIAKNKTKVHKEEKNVKSLKELLGES